MKYILTVDQSTFSTKVFLIDEMGQIHASKSIKHKQNYPENNWVEPVSYTHLTLPTILRV